MKYIQALCLAFAITTFGMSMVVYGQLSHSNQNSCLIIGFRNVTQTPPSRKYIKNANLRKVQEFFDYANIPLEISYVKNGSQFDPDNKVTFMASLPSNANQQQQLPQLHETQTNKRETENDSVKIVSAPLSQNLPENIKVISENISTQANIEEIEKPILRHPREFVND